MRVRQIAPALLFVGLALWPACRKAEEPKGGDGKTLRIAFVPKGTTHEFWRTIHAGAIKAQRDLAAKGVPVEILWKGPLREDDREQQVQVVESFASQGVDGIVLAPLDEKALVRPVEEAKRLGVPTVIVDSALASDQIVSFVATDNVKGGEMAADELGRLMGGKGRVLLLRYQEGSASTTAREEGFLARLKAGWPGLELVVADQYAGPTVDTAKRGLGEPAEPPRPRPAGRLRRQRDVLRRDAARPPGRGAGRQGEARGLRRHARPRGRDARGAPPRLRPPEPLPHGRARRPDDGRSPPREARAEARRHRRPRGDAREPRHPRGARLLNPPLDTYLKPGE